MFNDKVKCNDFRLLMIDSTYFVNYLRYIMSSFYMPPTPLDYARVLKKRGGLKVSALVEFVF